MNQHVRASDLLFKGEIAQPSSSSRVAFSRSSPLACKYIIGDPDENAVCCGARTDGKSWCSYHKRIVFEQR